MNEILNVVVGCIHFGCGVKHMFGAAFVPDAPMQLQGYGRLLDLDQLKSLVVCRRHSFAGDQPVEKVVTRSETIREIEIDRAKAGARAKAEDEIERGPRQMRHLTAGKIKAAELAAVASVRMQRPFDAEKFAAAIAKRQGPPVTAKPVVVVVAKQTVVEATPIKAVVIIASRPKLLGAKEVRKVAERAQKAKVAVAAQTKPAAKVITTRAERQFLVAKGLLTPFGAKVEPKPEPKPAQSTELLGRRAYTPAEGLPSYLGTAIAENVEWF